MTTEQTQELTAYIAQNTDVWAATVRRAFIPAFQQLASAVNHTWRVMRPYAIRMQIGIYAKPGTKKIRKLIRARRQPAVR